MPARKVERNRQILQRFAIGASIAELAREFEISRQRVDQILFDGRAPLIPRRVRLVPARNPMSRLGLDYVQLKLGNCGRARNRV